MQESNLLVLHPDCFLPMSHIENTITTRGHSDVNYQSNAACVHLLILVLLKNLNFKQTNKRLKTNYEDVGSTELKTRLHVDEPDNKACTPQ